MTAPDPRAPIVKGGLTFKSCGCCVEGRVRPEPVQIPAQAQPVSRAAPLLPLYRETREAFI